LLRGWYIFSEHPWFGVGTGGFVQAELNLPTHIAVAKSRFERKAAHAGWIKMLAENGIPGGALLLGYVLSFAAVGWRTRDRELRRLGVLTTTVLGLAFVSTEFQSKGLWFLAAGSTVLLQRRPAPDGLPARRRA
jgi:O-antigen ligase